MIFVYQLTTAHAYMQGYVTFYATHGLQVSWSEIASKRAVRTTKVARAFADKEATKKTKEAS